LQLFHLRILQKLLPLFQNTRNYNNHGISRICICNNLILLFLLQLETSIIIVADGGLGTINSTLLTVEYARANNIPIAGIILNNFNPDSFMHQDNLKQVEYLTGIKVVATVERGQKDIKLLEELWTGRKKI
jgi:dethiobiotin synthetase